MLIEKCQQVAAAQSLRISFLSGDVHVCGAGRLYSDPKVMLLALKSCQTSLFFAWQQGRWRVHPCSARRRQIFWSNLPCASTATCPSTLRQTLSRHHNCQAEALIPPCASLMTLPDKSTMQRARPACLMSFAWANVRPCR